MSDSNHQGGETLATLAINLLPIKRHWMAIRSSTDDAQLVKEAARGNQIAFRQLYERYYRPMASVIFRVCGTFVDVDDVLQDVFLRAWNGLPGFRQDAQFSTWLYRIAVNTALRHREKRKAERDRTQEDLEGDSHFLEAGESPTEATRQALLDPADVAINANQALVLRAAVDRLGEKHRSVVTMYYYDGKSCDEIAELLGTSVGTIWSRLHYAMKKLKDTMETER
jgi:RNA polymerase sigma-70 factor (ECF subfamily)